ncbi:PucR family transcriptional regulator ligand-binding domain-containing protein [Dactylosporangium roseum]|uniref:PucR family transcriptional regulator ligand-binding domain-containing protein n=1 Tax=Dactylosporangium roseum TaxID=47989 RepID=A0ABY5ZCD2_9ACTN|nr:PucR family transcriptional regulator [Dactylosporangium roseum]UWZ39729.1 PucR family transcriptional regulator ligand-binding domain-containing protein [Dactylosporangium roseum]
MTTLAGLSRSLGDDLARVGSVEAADEPLSGVHVSELRDPRPYLAGGELLLTTGMNLTMHTAPLRAYATMLVGHGLRGLALGLGPVHTRVPPVLVRVCNEAGLPLYVVPEPTPFQLVARRYWELLAAAGRADLDLALGAQRDLVRAATDRNPVAAVVRVLASAMDGWAAHLDPDGSVVTVWPRASRSSASQVGAEVRRLRAAGPHTAATFPLGDLDVAVQPLSRSGRLRGFVATAERQPGTPRNRQLLVTATSLLALAVELRHTGVLRRRSEREAVAALLLAGRVTAAHELVTAMSLDVLPGAAHLVVTGPLGRDAADELLDDCERHHLQVWGHWRADRLRLLVPVGKLAQVMALPLGDRGLVATGELALTAAMGGAIATTLRGAERILASVGACTRVDLTASPEPVDRGRRDWLALQALGQPELEAAAAAYLRHRGSWERAATELNCHRNTLRHRIAAVQRRAGIDLDDPTSAAGLWLAQLELSASAGMQMRPLDGFALPRGDATGSRRRLPEDTSSSSPR